MAHLKELFAIPSKGEQTGELNGKPLYSSESLDDKFIEAIKGCYYFDFVPNVEELVKSKQVVPVFTTTSVISFFLKKLPFAEGNISSLAFYDPISKKVFILIDNNTNLVGISSNQELGKLLVHELVHKGATEKSTIFLSLFRKNLSAFYKIALEKLFLSNLIQSEIEKFVVSLYKIELKKEVIWKSIFDFYYSSLEGKVGVNDKVLKTLIHDNVLATYYAVNDDSKAMIQPYIQLHYNIKNSYKDAFGINVGDKACFQEFVLVSEVISSISEFNLVSDKVKRLIKSLS